MAQSNTAGRGRLTLVLGGARSGKSHHAQILAMATPPPWIFVATAQALDAEMEERIANKGRARRGLGHDRGADRACGCDGDAPESAPVVVDCFTLWLSN